MNAPSLSNSLLVGLALTTALLLTHSPALESSNLILLPVEGDSQIDRTIARLQYQMSHEAPHREAVLERLGWAFIAKGRQESDPGFQLLALRCADQLGQHPGYENHAQLLRGHVYHQQHQFTKALAISRSLVESRGHHRDYALLGDALFDLGRVDAAADAYQGMMDRRPGLDAYVRAAQVRWIIGDTAGYQEALELAVQAGSPRQPEPLAWALSELGRCHHRAGQSAHALQAITNALKLLPQYAPALLERGRILLGRKRDDMALESLEKAAQIVPQPAYLWPLLECQTRLKHSDAAAETHAELIRRGAIEDPRTMALYLATTGVEVEKALHLAERELQERQDIYTHDAYAWALFANGRIEEAAKQMEAALSESTLDARIHLHAAVIQRAQGNHQAANQHQQIAEHGSLTLLPSEQALLGAGDGG